MRRNTLEIGGFRTDDGENSGPLRDFASRDADRGGDVGRPEVEAFKHVTSRYEWRSDPAFSRRTSLVSKPTDIRSAASANTAPATRPIRSGQRPLVKRRWTPQHPLRSVPAESGQ